MQIGLLLLMTENPQEDIISFLVIPSSCGPQESSKQCLISPMSFGTYPLPILQVKYYGQGLYLSKFPHLFPNLQYCGVTIKMPWLLLLIQCSILEANILNLISIFLETKYQLKKLMSVTFPLKINLLIVSPKLCLIYTRISTIKENLVFIFIPSQV